MATAKEKSPFEILNKINVNDHTETKNGLTYLSWAWAWAEVKKAFPTANYTVYENEHGFNYFTDGKTCWVKTGVTIDGLEHIEYLPVMDYKNKSIPLNALTSFDVNKAIQRSLTKACARHGLGLYIYAGEDLPESDNGAESAPMPKAAPAYICERCGRVIGSQGKNTPSQVASATKKLFGKQMCYECDKATKAEMTKAESEPVQDEPQLPFPMPD